MLGSAIARRPSMVALSIALRIKKLGHPLALPTPGTTPKIYIKTAVYALPTLQIVNDLTVPCSEVRPSFIVPLRIPRAFALSV